jgi:DNA-binding NtrC family response regulator
MECPRDGNDGSGSAALIAGTSAPIRALARTVGAAAASDVNLLVQGERGTGKRALAQALHRQSRKDGPFLAIGFADRSEADIKEELFDLLEEGVLLAGARGATLYLDEVAWLPVSLQALLARALHVANVQGTPRIIASTETDLNGLARAGRFLGELYGQLAPICLTIPPLRERREDIPAIVSEYLRTSHDAIGIGQVTLDCGALEELLAYWWPGNARELQETLAAALVQCPSGVISAASIRTILGRWPHLRAAPGVVPLDEFEDAYITRTLVRCNGNKALAARRLGIGRNTLLRRIKTIKLEAVADDRKRHGAAPAVHLVSRNGPAVANHGSRAASSVARS